MNRDTFRKLAIEAGLYSYCEEKDDAIERFAALVAEHVGTSRPDGCRAAIARARQEEREACANAAWDIVQYEVHADLADQVAAAIRARSEK